MEYKGVYKVVTKFAAGKQGWELLLKQHENLATWC